MSARIALLAALLAACHAPAAQASACPVPAAQAVGGVLAVALSLSKPGQYRFVVPVETNRLAGVGMGADAPSDDAPLRYEDAAFLAEAFAERRYIFGQNSGGITNGARKVTGEIICPSRSDYLQPFYAGLYGTNSWYSGYADPDCQMAEAIMEIGDGAGTADGREFFADIFGSATPFLSPSILPDDDFWKGGVPLTREKVAALYDDLSRLTRPCLSDVVLKPADGRAETTYKEERVYSNFTRYYSDIDRKWYFGTDSGTNYTETTEAKYYGGLRYSLWIRAQKQKARGFNSKGNGESGWTPTAVKASQATDLTLQRTFGSGRVMVDLRPGFAKLAGRTVRDVRVFGIGSLYLHMKTDGHTTRIETRRFAVPITVGKYAADDAAVFAVEIGREDCDDGIIAQAMELFGDPGYKTPSELMGVLDDPEEPSADYETYAPKYKSMELSRSVYIEHFLVVYDMEFAARVKEDGGED